MAVAPHRRYSAAQKRAVLATVGIRHIRTRVGHPESGARLERLRRTHGEQGPAGEELTDYYAGRNAQTRGAHYYNYALQQSALDYPRPVDHYHGDRAAQLAERKWKLAPNCGPRKEHCNLRSEDPEADRPCQR